MGQSNERGDGGIYIGSIMKGGAVAADGRIEPGDMLLQVPLPTLGGGMDTDREMSAPSVSCFLVWGGLPSPPNLASLPSLPIISPTQLHIPLLLLFPR